MNNISFYNIGISARNLILISFFLSNCFLVIFVTLNSRFCKIVLDGKRPFDVARGFDMVGRLVFNFLT